MPLRNFQSGLTLVGTVLLFLGSFNLWYCFQSYAIKQPLIYGALESAQKTIGINEATSKMLEASGADLATLLRCQLQNEKAEQILIEDKAKVAALENQFFWRRIGWGTTSIIAISLITASFIIQRKNPGNGFREQ